MRMHHLHGCTSMSMRVANVATIHRVHVFQTRGFLTAIKSHGGNFDFPDFPLPSLSPEPATGEPLPSDFAFESEAMAMSATDWVIKIDVWYCTGIQHRNLRIRQIKITVTGGRSLFTSTT